jgi:transposase InsO family protein
LQAAEVARVWGSVGRCLRLDLHSRRCVGFAMGAHHDAELARAALCVAIAVRGGAVAGVVFHTDQGGEYTATLFTDACARAGITQSMGRTGSALDNAVAEAFNSTLEFELLREHHFPTRERAPASGGRLDRRVQHRASFSRGPAGCRMTLL